MPQSNNTLFYDRDLLQTIVASQQGIDAVMLSSKTEQKI